MNRSYIKEQRIKKGLSIKDVSKALRYSQDNGYWKFENGVTGITSDRLMKLIDLLDLNIKKIMKYERRGE